MPEVLRVIVDIVRPFVVATTFGIATLAVGMAYQTYLLVWEGSAADLPLGGFQWFLAAILVFVVGVFAAARRPIPIRSRSMALAAAVIAASYAAVCALQPMLPAHLR